MPPFESLVVLSSAGLIGLGMVAAASAWGWSGWLRLRQHELDTGRASGDLPAIGQRIDLADLKERIRKLEAIAAGVDF